MSQKIGIIGGSGLDDPALLGDIRDEDVNTPWGKPSSPLRHGELDGVPVVLLARHGRAHTIPPTKVNYRANLHALKKAGCSHILVSTAVGSLREEMARGHLVVPDQFIDFTKSRAMTIFEDFTGGVSHTAMPDPFHEPLRQIFIRCLNDLGYPHHKQGTVITIEGPRFSTRAESRMYRILGADIVNMSVSTEAIIANEMGLPYAAVAMVTDYDAWKDDEEAASWEAISAIAKENADKVLTLLRRAIPEVAKLER